MKAMIKVNIPSINEELLRFNAAISRFRPYTEGFIKNTADKLKGFNSDYTDGIKRVLANMTDTNAPKLLEKAQNLQDITRKIISSYEKLEKEIEKKIGEKN